MPSEKKLPSRLALRLWNHDYSASGTYFLTFVTWNRICCLSRIDDGAVHLLPIGRLVADCLATMTERNSGVLIDASVLMPNHVHVLLRLAEERTAPRPVGDLLGGVKAATTRLARLAGLLGPRPLWQRAFYDRCVRDALELEATHRYIADNPRRWAHDPENPATLARHADPPPWEAARDLAAAERDASRITRAEGSLRPRTLGRRVHPSVRQPRK